jgi:hypothetical protein
MFCSSYVLLSFAVAYVIKWVGRGRGFVGRKEKGWLLGVSLLSIALLNFALLCFTLRYLASIVGSR